MLMACARDLCAHDICVTSACSWHVRGTNMIMTLCDICELMTSVRHLHAHHDMCAWHLHAHFVIYTASARAQCLEGIDMLAACARHVNARRMRKTSGCWPHVQDNYMLATSEGIC